MSRLGATSGILRTLSTMRWKMASIFSLIWPGRRVLKKTAIAYLRNGQIVIHASTSTMAGYSIPDEPMFLVDSVDHELIGRRIRTALAGGRTLIPAPPLNHDFMVRVRELFGVTSNRSLGKGLTMISIDEKDGSVSIGPYRQLKGGGHLLLAHHTIQIGRVSDRDLGDAALKAFQLCEGRR
ncbi:MAG: hypothetical protein U1E53_29680 [Dongiaceae bacterium]